MVKIVDLSEGMVNRVNRYAKEIKLRDIEYPCLISMFTVHA